MAKILLFWKSGLIKRGGRTCIEVQQKDTTHHASHYLCEGNMVNILLEQNEFNSVLQA